MVLLPLLYRLWAYNRDREIGSWLKEHGMEGQPVCSRSAEAYGYLLAAELERATVLNEPFLAVCTDQSKAYDTVYLEDLQYLLRRCELPDVIWKPMLNMARAPRRIKVLHAVGEWDDHTSGMLPGCPAATFVMTIVLERWRRFTIAVGPSTWVRSWVDDTTAAGRGSTARLATLVASTRAMEDLERGDGMQVNRVKPGDVVSRDSLELLVKEAAAIRSLAPYGLVAGFGPSEPGGWALRWKQLLQAHGATRLEWQGGGCEYPERDVRAVSAATTVWLAIDGQFAAASAS